MGKVKDTVGGVATEVNRNSALWCRGREACIVGGVSAKWSILAAPHVTGSDWTEYIEFLTPPTAISEQHSFVIMLLTKVAPMQ